ncbi:MAG: NAD(P)(+) transhydrogenase (Re/Si-specific) subunit beta, partial [Planctomycetota bacterium]
MSDFLRDLAYLLSASLFILGLRRLSSPRTAPAGNRLAAVGMFGAVVVTLVERGVLDSPWAPVGLALGAAVGAAAARAVRMTAMPPLVGIFNGLGGGASALVAVGEVARGGAPGEAAARTALALGALVGALTLSGSAVAFGKLQGLVASRPVTYPLQRPVNFALLGAALLAAVGFAAAAPEGALPAVVALALVVGAAVVLPIGGGDMPVVISLLNAYSGVAASMAGFVLGHKLLIVAGALVGASGLILTRLMCRAMNRPLTNVLFGAFGRIEAGAAAAAAERTARPATPPDAAILLTSARLVVV